MKRKKIIPTVSAMFSPTPKGVEFLEGVRDYLRNISPRISIQYWCNNGLKIDDFRQSVKALAAAHIGVNPDTVRVHDWVEKQTVAFVVSCDSAPSGAQKKYLPEDTYIFCYGDVAFNLNEFRVDAENMHDTLHHYNLQHCTPRQLEWDRVVSVIKDRISVIERSSHSVFV